MIDRYKKLIADVRSIDAAQVPHDTNLLAIIKEAVLGFTALWAQLEYNTPNITLDKALDIISRWRVAGTSKNAEDDKETKNVANFVSDAPNWKKKAFAKQAKAGYRDKSEKCLEQRRCLVSDKKGT